MFNSDIKLLARSMDETEAQDPLDGSFVEVSTTPAFECGICGRTFTKKDTLKCHLMMENSNVESVRLFSSPEPKALR